MHEISYQGEIRLTRYLDDQGVPLGEMPKWACGDSPWVTYYQQMVLARQFDTKAISLQRTGQMGTYASLLGAEAIDVVCASLMQPDDVLVPYYRNHAMQMIRGMSLTQLFLYWGGDERGSATPEMRRDLPNCVPIATQCLHACGVATALKLRGEHQAVLTMIGDGGTSKGDFLEAINVAGAWQLPVVFIINNNQWAISVPRSKQCIAPTLAQKALGAGIRGEQVDGNDAVALHEVVGQALERARAGKGPTLIEALSYRLSDHTTADDATRYRPSDELKAAWAREPVARLRNWLHSQGLWDEAREQAWQAETRQMIEDAVKAYQAIPPQTVDELYDYVYAECPAGLSEQREQARIRQQRREQGGTDHE
ncbi:pyruvate dehydrogenase (acetyl-transferring) E1 component subunit alpha [Marinobacterium sediminicola]|uniref:Pyruvate dehydrogenase E1 component subunit alpha n=1 Tax=Marinobacterium sediminicola TaxID=518898 RepID=A0ABY1RZZ5_9GAMM|nr:pyruvate dehydrogenase (acetyl-transferring) E1 component subunit alpha [Marinobacterium sediminicola]ULG69937.1 pyruvate dehydrogenase (acetyl-transferring) E1 component subunit alpha [Marinobacterium sediminicola]SMR74387.1 pyruvate dehydrogenase E1 component alpha subunit [Marinobacterium sediminicola]